MGVTEQLKPCPFCGGTDLYWPHGTDPAIIECGGFGCGARSGVPDEQTEAAAIAAWNRRRRGPAMTHSDTDPAVNPEPRLPVNSPGLTAGGFSPVAALFVEAGGSYYGLPGVDPWDETRDARKYRGPHPVVAHPPCQRWGKFWAGQPLWIARTGERKVKGDDGGCFDHALAMVRQCGGILEHPEGSHAWAKFNLNKPPRHGGWIMADGFLGWTCCVEQGAYGHYARKPTWLYAVGAKLPDLRWGKSEPTFPQWALDRYGLAKCKRAGELAFKGGGKDNHHRIGTPPEFRDLLLGIARSVPQ